MIEQKLLTDFSSMDKLILTFDLKIDQFVEDMLQLEEVPDDEKQQQKALETIREEKMAAETRKPPVQKKTT